MITLNGKDISSFGITLLLGAKEELFKYPKMKKGVRNESQNINGVQSDPKNRKYESRTVSLKFRLKGDTESDYNAKYISFLAEVENGKSNTGVNELFVSPYLFRLEYEDCQTYRPHTVIDCDFVISFFESNPANRQQ